LPAVISENLFGARYLAKNLPFVNLVYFNVQEECILEPPPPLLPAYLGPPLAHLYIPYSLPISAGEMLQDSNKCLSVARGGRRGQAQSIKSLRDYGVAMTSRLLKIIGLFCKRAF